MPELEQRTAQLPARRDELPARHAARGAVAREQAVALDRRHCLRRELALLAGSLAMDTRTASRRNRVATRRGLLRLAAALARRAAAALRRRVSRRVVSAPDVERRRSRQRVARRHGRAE